MKTRFIYNPRSGHNRRRPEFAQLIREFIVARRLDADFVATQSPGHATKLAREAVELGCDQVVAVGGDGTMNEVAQALIHRPAALALVPCGSGNGLALHLGIPCALRGALELIAGDDGRVALLDTGTADGRPFVNAMGLGLDADVSYRFNHLTERGLPGYLRTALTSVRQLRSQRVCVTNCSFRDEIEVLLLAVANSDQYGNNARIAPGARIDDGQLDLVAIAPVGLVEAAVLAARLFTGTIDASQRVRRFRGSRFTIDRVAPGLIHTDGESHFAPPRVEVCAHPRSLRVVVPHGSRAVRSPVDYAPAGLADFLT